MWAPSINRDYKNGEDILNLLKPNGEQNLRLAQLKLQEEEAKKSKHLLDTIYKEVFRILRIGLLQPLMLIRCGFCTLNEC